MENNINDKVILETNGITKAFPGVLALKGIDFTLMEGEVHAIVGENGAGKSTFVKVLTGAVKPDSGTITLEDITYRSLEIQEAKKIGINIIYQELNIIPELTVAENIYFGAEPKKGILIDKKKMNDDSKKIINNLGLNINPTIIAKRLGVAYQQIIEIAKALSQKMKVLIMDEPTAPLTNDEVEILFKTILNLKKSGVSIIYISHRLDEIFRMCDRATVFRDGNFIETIDVSKKDKGYLTKLMVGRELKNQYPRISKQQYKNFIEFKDLTNDKIKNISFLAKGGEILGIGGLVGAGRTEVARAIFGADKILSGKIKKNDKEIKISSPSDAIKNRIVLIPEDRKMQGLFLQLSIQDNIIFPNMKDFLSVFILNSRKIKNKVSDLIKTLNIRTPSENQLLRNLSGGNQQKVVLAKWLLSNAEVFILDEPTRGVDVGAKHEIYCLINELKKAGKIVIMISSEMEELIGMSDRIIVMYEKEITGELTGTDITQENILQLASNIKSINKK